MSQTLYPVTRESGPWMIIQANGHTNLKINIIPKIKYK